MSIKNLKKTTKTSKIQRGGALVCPSDLANTSSETGKALKEFVDGLRSAVTEEQVGAVFQKLKDAESATTNLNTSVIAMSEEFCKDLSPTKKTALMALLGESGNVSGLLGTVDYSAFVDEKPATEDATTVAPVAPVDPVAPVAEPTEGSALTGGAKKKVKKSTSKKLVKKVSKKPSKKQMGGAKKKSKTASKPASKKSSKKASKKTSKKISKKTSKKMTGGKKSSKKTSKKTSKKPSKKSSKKSVKK